MVNRTSITVGFPEDITIADSGSILFDPRINVNYVNTGSSWEPIMSTANNNRERHRIINCKCCNAILPKNIKYDDTVECEYCGAIQDAYEKI